MLSIFSGAIAFPFLPSFVNGNVFFIVMAFGCLAASGRLVISTKFGLVFALLFLHGLISIALRLNSLAEFLPIYISTIIFVTVFYNVIERMGGPNEAVRLYIKYTVFFFAVVIFQSFAYRSGIEFLYDYSPFFGNWVLVPGGPFGLRASGFFFEPSQVGLTGSLAIALSVARLLGYARNLIDMRSVIVILVAALLSASALAYFSIVAVFGAIALKVNLRVTVISIVLVYSAQFFNFGAISTIIDRFVGVYELFILDEAQGAANASSFSLFAHAQVAWIGFKETYWLGGGMGSHIISFEKYRSSLAEFHTISQLGTAGNLTNRLISELGIIGIGMMVWLLGKGIASLRHITTDPITLFAVLATVPFFARNGTYSYFGLAFLICIIGVKGTYKRQQNVPSA